MGHITIGKPLLGLQHNLYAKGLVQSELLNCNFPDVIAVETAIDNIESALTFGKEVCRRWVTAHVVEDGKKKYLANLPVCMVRFCINIY
jgi:hypothetical protein